MFNIKEMQIKTKMRKHFIPTGMARSKKPETRRSQSRRDYGEAGTHTRCRWGCKGYDHYGKQLDRFLKWFLK